MERSTHRVLTSDGIQISFDLYQASEQKAMLIICPGFFQSKETPTFQRLALTLADGRDVLTMDFRGHGRSSGLYSFSAKEHSDLEAVLEWAEARYQHLGVLGFSLGAAIAINTIGKRPGRVQSLVAVSAPCLFEDIDAKWWTPEAMRTGWQGLEPGAGCRPGNLFLKKPRPLEHVSRLSPVALLLIHGTRDAIVGLDHSHRLYAAAGQPKRLEIIEGGSHAEALFRDDPKRFSGLVREWFAQTLVRRAPSLLEEGPGDRMA